MPAGKDVTFHSVILAGVYDIKTLKLKLHPQEESKYNSLWNIADNNQMYMKVSSDRNQFIVSECCKCHWQCKSFMNIMKKFIQKKIKSLQKKMVGNYYIEARMRDNKRTDIIIDYKGEYIIETVV